MTSKKILDETAKRVLEIVEKRGYFMMLKVTKRWHEIVRFASMWNMGGLVIIGFCKQDYVRLSFSWENTAGKVMW